jgi:hypothetical protein
MKVWEAEQFLNQTTDVARSLSDPWELDEAKEYDYEGNPTGETHPLPFDATVLLDTIMLKGGELGILFNNIATYYKMNNSWWQKWKPTFQRWWEVEEIEYNPMWDRDGRRKFHEDIDDDGHSDTTTHDDGTDDTTYGETWAESGEDDRDIDFTTDRENHETPTGMVRVEVHDGTSDTYSKSHSRDTNSVSAYDAGSTLQTHDQQEHYAGLDGEGDSVKNTYGSTTDTTYDNHDVKTTEKTKTPDHTDNAGTYSKEGSKDSTNNRVTANDGTSNTLTGNERDIDHAYREWGQWGISTISQNMYALQIKVRYQNNLYEKMSDIFIREMTDGVWV